MNKQHFNSTILVGIAAFSILLFAGCAHREIVTQCVHGEPYGFLYGLLHGFIAPFDLVGMLFRDDITVYAQNNNGAWYAFGFLIGSGGWGIIGGHSARRRSRRN